MSRFTGLLAGLLVAGAGLVAVAVAPWIDIEEGLGLPWLFALRGPVSAPPEVVVVAVDEESAKALGLSEKTRNWPRSLHAELVDHLARSGASVICFDMAFENPTAGPHDEAFAAAIARAGNVVLIESVRRETRRLPGGALVLTDRVTAPIPALEQASLARAPFLLPKRSRVSAYWTFWTFHEDAGGEAPTLPVAAFHVHAPAAFADFAAAVPDASGRAWSGLSLDRTRLLASDAGATTISQLRNAMEDSAVRRAVLERLDAPNQGGAPPDRRRLARAFAALYGSDAATYLNFYGPPRSITTLSYSSVLAAARSTPAGQTPFDFRNKALFIGSSAATQAGQDVVRDDYRTVYSRSDGVDTSGVEIAATAFGNLVEGRPVRPLSRGWQSALVLAWGLASGLACRRFRPAWAGAGVAAAALAYLGLACQQFADAALWVPLAIPLTVQAPLALLLGVALHYGDLRRERATIKRAFGYFLPADLVDRLARNIGPVTQANEVVFGACLATDVERYTGLAERMAPAKLGELMNTYYGELFVPVERRGGVVVDIVGDAMIAVWAAAATDAHRRANACDAALEALAALDRFNASSPEATGLLTRFGLHAGDMLLGSIGGSRHYEYRAVGDIVNTASRIQGLNKVLGTRLLVSQETMQGLDQFAVRPLGSFLLPGKENAVSVVELLGSAHALDSDVRRLCDSFGEALEAYRAGRWAQAKQRFGTILDTTPADGPSRFYMKRCDELLHEPPQDGWSSMPVRVNTK